jgi:cytoskeletal protein CcmA (bactofilin family)
MTDQTITGDLSLNGNLKIDGKINTGTGNANTHFLLGEKAYVGSYSGNDKNYLQMSTTSFKIENDGLLQIAGDLNAQGTFVTAGMAVQSGAVTFSDKAVYSYIDNNGVIPSIESQGSVIVNKSLSVGGTDTNYLYDVSLNANTFVAGDLSLNGNLVLNGSVTAPDNSIPASAINGTTDTDYTVDIAMDKTLTVAGDASFNGNVVLDKHLTVTADTHLNNRLFLQKDSVIYGNTFVNKDLHVYGNLKVDTVENVHNLTVNDYQHITAEDLSMNGRLFVNGDVSFNDDVYIKGGLTIDGSVTAPTGSIPASAISGLVGADYTVDISMDKTLTVGGDASFNGNVVIDGTLKVRDVQNNDIYNMQVTNYSLIIAEDLSLNNRLFIMQDASFNEDVHVAGDLNVDGSITNATWVGDAINDAYISSAANWNAKQSALTFGTSNTNAVKIDSANNAATSGTYARFTASGVEGRTANNVKIDLGLENVTNESKATMFSTAPNNSIPASAISGLVGADYTVDISMDKTLTVGGDVSMNSGLVVTGSVTAGSFIGNLNGNATTVTNGVYTTDVTSFGSGQIITNDERTKLAGITSNQIIDWTASGAGTIDPSNYVNTTYTNATTTADGLMDKDDKSKLNGIAAGAEVNVQSDWNATEGDALILNKPTIPSGDAIIDWTDDQSGSNKTIHASNYINTTYNNATTAVAGLMSTADKSKLNDIASGAEVNVQSDWNASSGDALILNKPTIPSGNQIIDWTANGAGTIHSSNYVNTTYTVGDGGLTENDFTTTLKNKLDGIAEGAEVNVKSDWNVTDSDADAYIKNKPTIPSGNQIIDWTVDHASEVIHANNYTNTTYNNATTSDAGLMSTSDKSKLDGIAASANNYSLPTAASDTLGGIKVGTNLSIDGNGVLSSADTIYNNATTNAAGLMSTAHYDKLEAIEALADVTDATNVLAAGAVMTTGDQTIAGAKTFSSIITGSIDGNAATATTAGTVTTAAQSAITSVGELTGLTITGDLSLNQNLSMNGDASFNGDVHIVGNLKADKINNDYIINTETLNYTLIVAEDLSLNNRLFIKGDASFNEDVYIKGNLISSVATTTANGLMSSSDKSKLDGIEANADVTNATSVEAAGALMDSEVTDLAGIKGVTISTLQVKPSEGAFADGDKTKLDSIATNADVTNSTSVEAAGALMDSEVTDLAGIKGVTISTLQVKPSEGAFADGDKTKLDGIAANANNYSLPKAADDTLGGIKVGTNLSIDGNGVLSSADTTYNNATTNAAGLMSTTHYDKLEAIEALADVTDATNVLAAGAVMDTGDQTIGGEKTFSSTITGSIDGNAATATKAQVTLNNTTNESNVIAFVANASATTGAHDLEMDENLTYNPSTDTLTVPNLVASTGITGTLQTAAQPNITSVGTLNSVDIDGGAIDGTAIGANSASTGKFSTLNASDATTLDGAVTLGNASGDAVTVEGTITVKNTATFTGVIHQF